jgi:membrane protein DedA with SNARE-associated domain/rhodanese-related sulfurtransferase
MQSVITLLEGHGLLVIFLNALLAQGGLPLPIIPTLLVAAALVSQSPLKIIEVVFAGVFGTLIADCLQYWCGRRYGQRFLGLLCRISFSPDFCVRRTQEVFARLGPWSLILAKFIPGLSLISVAMAGVTKMSAITFLLLDLVGGILFIAVVVLLGVLFQDAIASLLSTLVDYGKFGVFAVVAAIGLYVFIKWLQRRVFIHQLRMDRVTVAELRELIDKGSGILILDVRPTKVRAHDGVIPGAVPAHPTDIDPTIMDYPRDVEVVVYCACPNEESAATAAKHLKRAGFKKIRPLLGGIDAWIQAGHKVERAQSTEDVA